MENKNVMPWLFRSVRRWIPALVLLTIGHIVGAIFGAVYSLGYRDVVDSATGGDWQLFVRACVAQGLLVLAILVNNSLCYYLKERLNAAMDRGLKKKMLRTLLRGEYAKVSQYHTGDLLSLMNHDVQVMLSSILTLLPSIAGMITKLVASLWVLIGMEPRIAYVVVIAGVVVVSVTGFIRRNLKNLNKKASKAQGKVSGFIQESLEKLLMVQAMDISDVMEERANGMLNERYHLHRKKRNIAVVSSTCISALAFGSGFGALVFCANGIFHGTMTFGTLTAISQLVANVRGPFTNMSGIMPQYAALSASAERLMELDKVCDTTPVERKDAETLYENMTAIEATELTFAYDRDLVFDHASFRLPKGSFGVIVGHSGIGKSTLLKLLLGIFPPKSGSLHIAGEQGNVEIDRSTRRLFAYVPQGNLLLSGTLRDNLTVTNRNATQEQIERAIYVSAMDAYLPTLPDGLDTVVGENALGLSEGQAQRLSIARAILSDAPILLLDEATSALDDETEKVVLQRIRQLPGKTCIAVTHRSAATEVADWALEMHEGKCTVTYR